MTSAADMQPYHKPDVMGKPIPEGRPVEPTPPETRIMRTPSPKISMNWIAIVFVLYSLCAFLFGNWVYKAQVGEEAIEYRKAHKAAITECQRTLPRNRHCGAKWQTFVKPLVHTSKIGGTTVTETVKFDKNGKEIK
ncbi:hypothetical protein N9937_00195 [bacterium]|nr:hypothetical protein [bacterium]